MDQTPAQQDTLTRLIYCAAAAFALYYGLQKLLDKGSLPALEPYRPWLKEHKLQTIALVAAALFGLSLLLPPSQGEKQPQSPCGGYEPVE